MQLEYLVNTALIAAGVALLARMAIETVIDVYERHRANGDAAADSKRHALRGCSIAAILIAIAVRAPITSKWIPEEFEPQITQQKRGLFGSKDVTCEWRTIEEGKAGWCTKDTKGKWYLYVDSSEFDFTLED